MDEAALTMDGVGSSSSSSRTRLPIEIIVDILVNAAANPSINNRQRLELCRVCRAGHLAIHRRVLLPSVQLDSAEEVHAFARTLAQSVEVAQLARRVTKTVSITVGQDQRSGGLYGQVQHQADQEQNLVTPLRAILAIVSPERFCTDLTAAPLDYRLRRTAIVSKSAKRIGHHKKQQGWTWGRAAISHRAHVERRIQDALGEFRAHLRELVCAQNILGGGDFVDQLNVDCLPSRQLHPLGRWDRLEDLQLLGPRFRLTCTSARTLALGLPSLKRLALVMPNIMPPDRTDGPDEEDAVDDPEELGRDLFLRMSPLQLLIDTLCSGATVGASASTPKAPQFQHLLIVGHDLPTYVGSAAKLRRWIEALQYRVRQTASSSDQRERYYVDPDSRLVSAGLDPDEADVGQPRIQLLTARLRDEAEASESPHPLSIARWMLTRMQTGTHWTFGPDHASRSANLCTRPTMSINAMIGPNAGDETGLPIEVDAQQLERRRVVAMRFLESDEAMYRDDDEEVEYTIENFELPVTVLRSQSTSSEQDGAGRVQTASQSQSQVDASTSLPSGPQLLDASADANEEQEEDVEMDLGDLTTENASPPSNETPSSHIFLPHSFGPSRSGATSHLGAAQSQHGHSAGPEQAGPASGRYPDLDYVDAVLRREQALHSSFKMFDHGRDAREDGGGERTRRTTTTIETIHPGRPSSAEPSSSTSADEKRPITSSGGGGVSGLASSLASLLNSGWSGAWRSEGTR